MPLLLLTFLKNNWIHIFIILAFIAWSFGCYQQGRRDKQGQWDAAKVEEMNAIQEMRDKAIDDANVKSAELEKSLSAQREANKKLNGRLANEIKKNATAYGCTVPNDGVQIFNSSTAKGDGSS